MRAASLADLLDSGSVPARLGFSLILFRMMLLA